MATSWTRVASHRWCLLLWVHTVSAVGVVDLWPDGHGGADDTTLTTGSTTATAARFATVQLLQQATISSSTTTTTSTTTTPDRVEAGGACGGLSRCVAHASCATCLAAINSTLGVHSNTELSALVLDEVRWYQIEFVRALISTSACYPNATPPSILHPALSELSIPNCMSAFGIAVRPPRRCPLPACPLSLT
jgi:hypothetical protein